MTAALRRISALLRRESGYSLPELVTVTVVLGIVLTALTNLFVAGSNAELDLNKRFQAQLNARLALDKLRREAHCASVLTPTGTSGAITMTLPTGCPTGSGSVSWCTVSVGGGSTRYQLYRKAGVSCNSTGATLLADYITTAQVFTYTPQSTTSLAKLHVDFPVDIDTLSTTRAYELVDDIVLRNSTRS